MRSFFVGVPVVVLSLGVLSGVVGLACSDTVVNRVTTNPVPEEGGMELEDGAVVDQDGDIVTSDGAKASQVDVSTGTVNGFTSDRGPYVLAVPKTYATSKKYPLIVVIHDNGGNGAGMRSYHPLDTETGSDAIAPRAADA